MNDTEMTDSMTELKGKNGSTVILVNSNGMGVAGERLQHKLLSIYLTILLDSELYAGAICFYGDGVKMTVEESTVIELLHELEVKGVRLIICITCLKYLGLEGKVAVGIMGGMHEILLAQWMADKVITL